MYQNLWEAAKVVLRGKYTVINAYVKKKKDFKQQSNFIPQRTRKRTNKPKVIRKKAIIRIKAKINEIESRNTIKKIHEIMRFF